MMQRSQFVRSSYQKFREQFKPLNLSDDTYNFLYYTALHAVLKSLRTSENTEVSAYAYLAVDFFRNIQNVFIEDILQMQSDSKAFKDFKWRETIYFRLENSLSKVTIIKELAHKLLKMYCHQVYDNLMENFTNRLNVLE